MSSPPFLSGSEEQRIVDAIAAAEKQTSAEIRIHIEPHCPESDALNRAAQLFHALGMDETEQRNGVLIYIAPDDHQAAVFAGRGIHEQVEESFWLDVLAILLAHFKEKEHAIGITKAVDKVGRKLQQMYPYQRGDVNELSNEISYSENGDQ